jgi:hypothetical protein
VAECRAMRKRSGLAAAGFGVVLLLLASLGRAAQEELLDQARRLVADSKPFVQAANDVDAELAARRAPRKEAFKRLKEAHSLYDKYLDANPSKEEAIDKEYVEMMVLLHGIKKDSAIGELERDDAPAAGGDPAKQPGDDPPAPAGDDPARPKGGGADPAGGQTPAPPPAAPDAAVRAKQRLSEVRDFEKSHPGDLPQIQKLYSAFLAEFPDPALPEYTDAATRLGAVNDRIKSVFQTATKRDYDTLAGSDTKDETKVLNRLTQDLASKDQDVRRRAAKLLTATRSRSATYFLARGLADKDDEFAKLCRDGVVAIGGTYAGENLVKLYRNSPGEKQALALDVFCDIVKKGPFEAVNQSRAIGRFTLSNEGPVAVAAFKLLASMGPQGGPGLAVALDSRVMEKKTYAMDKMLEARYWKGAGFLAGRYLVEGKDGGTVLLRNHAMATIEKMGAYAVPHLIDLLHGPTGRYTGMVLTKITGVEIEADEVKKAREWWDVHKPKDAE